MKHKSDIHRLLLVIFGTFFVVLSVLVYLMWFIPQGQKILEPSTITNLSQLIGAEVALLTLMFTAENIYKEYRRQKKTRSSWYVQKWFSPEMDTHVVDVKNLKNFIDEAKSEKKREAIYKHFKNENVTNVEDVKKNYKRNGSE